jgi:hypothetical protein
MEMSSYACACQLQGDVRDCETALIWKVVLSDFISYYRDEYLVFYKSQKVFGLHVIVVIRRSVKIRNLCARIPVFFQFSQKNQAQSTVFIFIYLEILATSFGMLWPSSGCSKKTYPVLKSGVSMFVFFLEEPAMAITCRNL